MLLERVPEALRYKVLKRALRTDVLQKSDLKTSIKGPFKKRYRQTTSSRFPDGSSKNAA